MIKFVRDLLKMDDFLHVNYKTDHHDIPVNEMLLKVTF
jgi:hypothetical protein